MNNKTIEYFAGADFFDSRDVEERIDELEGEVEATTEAIADIELSLEDNDFPEDSDDRDNLRAELQELNEELADLQEELAKLTTLRNDCGSSEWTYGLGLINDDYFEQYAQELAEDIGAIDRNASWPLYHIDWAAAAESLKVDYSSVEFEGSTFWYRA